MRRLALAIAVACLSGCGPIRSTQSIVGAQKAWQAAQDAGAAERAPYPFVLSAELLRKAKEQQGYAEYSSSFALANEAKDLADEALRATQAGDAVPLPPAAEAPAEATPRGLWGAPTEGSKADDSGGVGNGAEGGGLWGTPPAAGGNGTSGGATGDGSSGAAGGNGTSGGATGDGSSGAADGSGTSGAGDADKSDDAKQPDEAPNPWATPRKAGGSEGVAVRALAVLLTLGLAGCGAGFAELRGVHASLREAIHAAKAGGAMECAPAELAHAQASYRLAQLELEQGRTGRAWDEVEAGLLAMTAWQAVADRCSSRGAPATDQTGDPWVDADGDGVVEDGCPYRIEDLDGFQDLDGCPEPDNDLDGYLDAVDLCPALPEDVDGFDDGDGCPDPDNDNDGLLDGVDACPDRPETNNGWRDDDGCPDIHAELLEVQPDRVVLLAPVRFADGSATLLPQSLPTVRELALLLKLNPSVRIRIDVHTDNQGDQAQLIELSRTRGLILIEALGSDGVDRRRLSSQGYGGESPITTNRTDVGRRLNARVEISVIEGRLPPGGLP